MQSSSCFKKRQNCTKKSAENRIPIQHVPLVPLWDRLGTHFGPIKLTKVPFWRCSGDTLGVPGNFWGATGVHFVALGAVCGLLRTHVMLQLWPETPETSKSVSARSKVPKGQLVFRLFLKPTGLLGSLWGRQKTMRIVVLTSTISIFMYVNIYIYIYIRVYIYIYICI